MQRRDVVMMFRPPFARTDHDEPVLQTVSQ
ncbi:MAG: hypothetical protein J07HX64_02955 [halophilic archaeon J07HX64]|nr:MAG: hypothetical protein J07HX64_02955 [halophilic archaeon J07HX64]